MYNVENRILSKEFEYFEPYFYNNELSYRCELGVGDGRKYLSNALARAETICSILFPEGLDAFFYESKFYDYDYNTEDVLKGCSKEVLSSLKKDVTFISDMVKKETKFNLLYQQKYRHKVVRNALSYSTEDIDDGLIQSNRIVCYIQNDFSVSKEIKSRFADPSRRILHFVSFRNECIMSIYDIRGCDIVFFDEAKYVAFYDKLSPYFLEYDRELMKSRRNNVAERIAK